MNAEKQPERMFKQTDDFECDIILRRWNKRAEEEGNPLAERVEVVTCEHCGEDRHNIYTSEGLKSYCFSRKCDPKLQVLKSKEQQRIDFHWSFSKVPLSLKTASFDNYKRDNKQTLQAYQGANYYAHEVSKSNPIRLAIHGSNGTGKSHLAISVVKTVMKRQKNEMSCLFISQQEILEMIQSSWSKDHKHDQEYYYKIFEDVDILVIDDFGIGLNSQFALGTMTNIINKRSGKALIITTNLSPKQLASDANLGRVDSKLSEKAHVIELVSDDYRKKSVKVLKDINPSEQVEQTRVEDFTMQQKKNDEILPYDINNPPF